MADVLGLSDLLTDEGWVTSSFSTGSGQCVEVKHARAVVAVRDSKNRTGGLLAFPAATWAGFLATV